MDCIIVATSNIEDAFRLGGMLRRRGLEPSVICNTAAHLLSHVHEYDQGIVVCSRRLPDMYCTTLLEYLPSTFEMLIITSAAGLQDCPKEASTLVMPFKAMDLYETIEQMLTALHRRIKRENKKPKSRSPEEKRLIDEAKKLLMKQKDMTEQEAFRYIQKSSMDAGANMKETAEKILALYA